MNTYCPHAFAERVKVKLQERTSTTSIHDKLYKQEYLNMCVAANVPCSFLYDIEEYEQKPRVEVVEKLAAFFEVPGLVLLYGN